MCPSHRSKAHASSLLSFPPARALDQAQQRLAHAEESHGAGNDEASALHSNRTFYCEAWQ